MPKKQLQGVVVSDKMNKTIVVEVQEWKKHPKYGRRFRSHARYKAHDESSAFHTGDTVVIEETRPLSRDKRWRVLQKQS